MVLTTPSSTDGNQLQVAPRRSLPHVAFLVLSTLAVVNTAGAVAPVTEGGGDFAMMVQSAAAWVHGALPYLPIQGTPTTNLNHPLLWLVFLPFSLLPQFVAFVAWTALSVALLVLAAPKVARIASVPALDIIVFTLALTGSSFELALGQASFILMMLLMAAWLLDREGRTVSAGACVGALCVLKPFYGLLALMFVWRRQWRAVLASVAAAVLVLVLGWAMAGTSGYVAWIENLRHVSWTWHIFNGSVWGAAARVLTPQHIVIATQWTPIANSPAAATIVSLLGAVVVCVLLWRGLRAADIDQTYALLALASLLLSPLGWVYYLPACFGPIAVVLARNPSRWLWLVGSIAICPYWLLVDKRYSMLATATIGQISLVVVGGLFLLVYATTRCHDDAGRV